MGPIRPHYSARTQLAILLSSTAFVVAPLGAQQGGNTVAVNLLLPRPSRLRKGLLILEMRLRTSARLNSRPFSLCRRRHSLLRPRLPRCRLFL